MIGWRALGAAVALAGCSAPPPDPILPVSYASTYTRVRPCRVSPDHDLDYVLVFADPLATPAYQGRMEAFPTGSILVKEEHAGDDVDCTGPVLQWTVMEKLAPKSSTLTADWRWQLMDVDRKVVTQDDKRCISCHHDCGVAPDGYQGTCSPP